MTARGTTFLLAALAVLLAWLWLERPVPTRPSTVPSFLTVGPDAVARLDLTERGRRLTALRRDGDWVDETGQRWTDDAPVSLVATLGSIGPLMIVATDPADPSEYGLGADAGRLELHATDGATLLALDIGLRNPSTTGIYARRAGQRDVLLVGAILAWELDKLRAAAPKG